MFGWNSYCTAVAGAIAVLVGCGPAERSPASDAGDEGPRADAVSFARDIQPIFDARCTSCHYTPEPGAPDAAEAAAPDLTPGAAWSQLVGAPSTCNPTRRLVVPGSPAESALLRTLDAAQTDCGNPMPKNSAGLRAIAPREYARIEAWIADGAPAN